MHRQSTSEDFDFETGHHSTQKRSSFIAEVNPELRNTGHTSAFGVPKPDKFVVNTKMACTSLNFFKPRREGAKKSLGVLKTTKNIPMPTSAVFRKTVTGFVSS